MSDPQSTSAARDMPDRPTPAFPPQPDNTNTPVPSKALTEEEQMALYEKDLKENDWGHQPC